jgi:O-antigen ligase
VTGSLRRLGVSSYSAPVARRATSSGTRRTLTVPFLAALAIIVLSPWAFDPWGLQQRLPLAVLIVIVAAPIGVGAAIARGSLVLHQALWPFAALLAWLTAATVVGITPFSSLIGTPARALGLVGWFAFAVCFVLGLQLGAEGTTRRGLQFALVLGSLPVAMLALVERRGDLFALGQGDDLVRSQSTLRNPVFLGAYLVLALPVALMTALDRAEKPTVRIAALVAVLIDLAALAATQSRGPWLGAVVAFVVVAVASLRDRSRSIRLASVAFAVVALVAVLASPLRDRALSVGRTDTGSNAIRTQLYGRGIELVKSRPILGFGPDATAAALPRVLNDEFELKVSRKLEPDRIHNTELDMAVWGGIPALLLYLGVVMVIGQRAWKRRATLPIGLSAACLGYFVQLQVSFPLADVDAIAWVLAGVLVAADGRSVRVPRLLGGSVRTALVLVGMLAGIWQVRAVGADHLLGRAVRAEVTGDDVAAARLYGRAAKQATERAQTWQAVARFGLRAAERGNTAYLESSAVAAHRALSLVPDEPTYLLDDLDIRLQLAILKHDEAELLAVDADARALVTSDPSSAAAWFIVGSIDATEGKSAEAVAAWERAASLAPWATGPRLNLGASAAARGDRVAAERWYREVLALQPDEPSATAFLGISSA